MLIITLPGYSLQNKEDNQAIAADLREQEYDVYAHAWRHWVDESIEFDPVIEATELLEVIDRSGEQELIIIAKSMGTWVAVELISRLPEEVKLKKVIIMGVPYTSLDKKDNAKYETVLNALTIPVYWIQNELDPHGNFEAVKEWLGQVTFTKSINVQGIANHKYADVELIGKLVSLET
jgi:pimeloyl-ACP methyl ester carboxylesterase